MFGMNNVVKGRGPRRTRSRYATLKIQIQLCIVNFLTCSYNIPKSILVFSPKSKCTSYTSILYFQCRVSFIDRLQIASASRTVLSRFLLFILSTLVDISFFAFFVFSFQPQFMLSRNCYSIQQFDGYLRSQNTKSWKIFRIGGS